jgi:DNA-directed RNA polymerase subunit M/transcription elongation factor TFIIS
MLCSGCAKGYPEEPGIDEVRREAIVHLAGVLAEPAARQAMARRLGDAAKPTSVAMVIEHGIAVWSEAKCKQYARKLYSILWALRCEPLVLSRADPWDLAFLREESLIQTVPEEGSSSLQNAHDHKLQEIGAMIDALQRELKERVEKVSVVAKRACPRCGSNETERIAVQTRSADEGMTQMLQCTSCGQRVRI